MIGLISSAGPAPAGWNPEARSTRVIAMAYFVPRTRNFIHSSFAVVALLRLSFGEVNSWIVIKKTVRHESEAGGVHSHDRPVFGARDVGYSERVPDHDIAILE